MDVFELRERLVGDFSSYVRSFIRIRDNRIREKVDGEFEKGLLWPEPLVQLNPSFEPGPWISELVDSGDLDPECLNIFRGRKSAGSDGMPMRLYRHQAEALMAARSGANFVLTTGTGSGKSLTYIIPIVDHVLRNGSGKGIQAIIVYPMNALANSQAGELEKFLNHGYPKGVAPVTFERYTGQESDEDKQRIVDNPPDILLTNYVMLELILTRPRERRLINAAKGLKFLVLDELHTYRGRQGADVALLVRRLRNILEADALKCIGTSATIAGGGGIREQRVQVAKMASLLFGDKVEAHHIIGETLRRTTPELDFSTSTEREKLKNSVLETDRAASPSRLDDFLNAPLSSWIESNLGVETEEETGRLIRKEPLPLRGPADNAAHRLAQLTGLKEELCGRALEKALMEGFRLNHPETQFPVFAFRLHQFISRGDTVYTSLRPPNERFITLKAQQFVPGDRESILLPLAFCRECGQEYHVVRRRSSEDADQIIFEARDLGDRAAEDDATAGFLVSVDAVDWPESIEDVTRRIPNNWLEVFHGNPRVKKHFKKYLPQIITVDGLGRKGGTGHAMWFFPAPMSFCMNCGVTYASRRESDFAHMGTLSSEGRSTATTILALSTIMQLKAEDSLEKRARKLLSFTDNRQDASLQAGHFNDFIEVALLRAALYKAVEQAGSGGLREERLTQAVFDALDLPLDLYAVDPDVRYQALYDAQRVLRDVIGYRLYRDLKRGWRITAPNLEQSGLLEIEYPSLGELSRDEELWSSCHGALTEATSETRRNVAHTLLDYMRRELAIKVDYLDQGRQEQFQRASRQHLNERWAIPEEETMEHSSILFPRSRRKDDFGGYIFLSARGSFGAFLRRPDTFPDVKEKLSLEETTRIITDLLEKLRIAGLVRRVVEARNEEDVHGYQLPASAIVWKPGGGTQAHHDPIRVPRLPEEGRRPNRFFVDLYRHIALEAKSFEGREHTAQVPAHLREEREHRFRKGDLPILFCSPTMELGVDISELNVVNMRNVPPTPANYAQRSGRAGRSGQPALVFTYCTQGSPHDQYYFRRPQRMVSGAVTPPRLDLANEDLIRSHLQAIWLAEASVDLKSSLRDLLDLAGEPPRLKLLPELLDSLKSRGARERARIRATAVLQDIQAELCDAPWFSDDWTETVFHEIRQRFEQACERWQSLYRMAWSQADQQGKIILDASRPAGDKEQAKRLRREAESQLELLRGDANDIRHSDFYSYRYFAGEGFLPGYAFPRLPLSAFIPGRRHRRGSDEFLSRPRFLAISEFGPRNFIYYEGARYLINKVLLSVTDDGVATQNAKICDACGYIHLSKELGTGPDVCDNCRAPLEHLIGPLLRMENVSTRRRERITSDEEERLRMGYELQTGIRFAEIGGRKACRVATTHDKVGPVATLKYGHAASLWRINLGWRRRANNDQLGFVLDLERGYWKRNDAVEEDPSTDALSARTKRVVPFVRDTKNCLLINLDETVVGGAASEILALRPDLTRDRAAAVVQLSFGYALKQGIQAVFQLEDNELAAEVLPTDSDPKVLLLYEAAEGGAGVLRQLIDDLDALERITREALSICHFDPETGEDLRHARGADEDCEAACYDCLLSYSNQRVHQRLDRQAIRSLLLRLKSAKVEVSPIAEPRPAHLERLRKQADSTLELAFLDFLNDNGLHLPSDAQVHMPDCNTCPDFVYRDNLVVIYVDGPVHDYPHRARRDLAQQTCLEDLGYTVIRFSHRDEWKKIVERFPSVFGQVEQTTEEIPAASQLDFDLFDPAWHPLIKALLERGYEVRDGGDVVAGNRIIGQFVLEIIVGDTKLKVFDANDSSSRQCFEAPAAVGEHNILVRPSDMVGTFETIEKMIKNEGAEE